MMRGRRLPVALGAIEASQQSEEKVEEEVIPGGF